MQGGASDELAEVLGNPNLSESFAMQVMKDGVVLFECPEKAEAFRNMLEAAGHLQVFVSEINSHAIFRALEDVDGLVVLVGKGGDDFMPTPAELAAALRQKPAFEDL
jgi:hypothetical protein